MKDYTIHCRNFKKNEMVALPDDAFGVTVVEELVYHLHGAPDVQYKVTWLKRYKEVGVSLEASVEDAIGDKKGEALKHKVMKKPPGRPKSKQK